MTSGSWQYYLICSHTFNVQDVPTYSTYVISYHILAICFKKSYIDHFETFLLKTWLLEADSTEKRMAYILHLKPNPKIHLRQIFHFGFTNSLEKNWKFVEFTYNNTLYALDKFQ